ncbi:MAG: hypothetical protein ABI255_02135 [Microbacteriaceae bacterium]
MNLPLPPGIGPVLTALLILGASVWIGGMIAITLVSASSRKALDPRARVALFREVGRRYLWVATVAFALIAIPGGVLLAARPWDGLSLTTVIAVAILVITTGIAIRQARLMTKRRAASHAAPEDDLLAAAVSRAGTAASRLRLVIALISAVLFVLAIWLSA